MPQLALEHSRPPSAPDTLDALRRGDPAAITSCFREHGDALMALAYRLTGSRTDAEDVVQDVFVGLPDALRRYEERGNFAGWLKRVTARTALMERRRTARRQETPRDISAIAGREQPSESVQVRLDVGAALARLTPALRQVFVLKVVEGYSHVEIAALLEISTNTSEVRLCRAVAALRTMLGNQ